MKHLLTKYANIDPSDVLSEYPRPQFKRDSYINLNGLWDFSISKDKENTSYNESILVPFSPETPLSKIHRKVELDQYLFYHKNVTLPLDFIKNKVFLHFGAVDQICDVWINDQFVIQHIGGFTPFTLDVGKYIKDNQIDIKLRVMDITDTSYHLTGKQRIQHNGIWYTPQSGIWQSVWLESVPKDYIESIKITPLFDDSSVKIDIKAIGSGSPKIMISDNSKIIKEFDGQLSNTIKLDSFIPWTPENPYLYEIKIIFNDDIIHSYFGMRLFEHKIDKSGIHRFYLNHEPYFQNGVLDQGYFSDGFLTPPSDQAMIDDIVSMKNMGFNMLRKHIKIEPLRWYYHCDRLGMLVWQDMINGSERKDIVFHGVLAILGIHIKDQKYKRFGRDNKIGKDLYEKDLDIMLCYLKNVVSLCTWVPFNEAWGQFDAKRIAKHVHEVDPTRLIDHASGWSDQGVGDYHSRHTYFTPIYFRKKDAKKRILALTEFGGYSLPIDGHRYQDDQVFGYKKFTNKKDFEDAINKLYLKKIEPNIKKGLSVLIYTQLSDVEDEVNGFLTYDRKIQKIDSKLMKSINEKIIIAFNQNL
jgi:beta-galactosidase/beta-glucuronidase